MKTIKIEHLEISARCKTSLYEYYYNVIDGPKRHDWEITINDLGVLDAQKLLSLRNVGEGTVRDVIKYFTENELNIININPPSKPRRKMRKKFTRAVRKKFN